MELERRDQARAARVAAARDAIDGLQEQCRGLSEEMNAALMPRSNDPMKAINLERARELQAQVERLRSDISLHEAVIEAARQDVRVLAFAMTRTTLSNVLRDHVTGLGDDTPEQHRPS
jgi:hypothetical protein